MTSLIPCLIETHRLVIAKATMNDGEALQKICDSWDDKVLMEGAPFEPGYILKCLQEGDLPPISGATKLNYRLMCFFSKETGMLLGFTDIYHGYPIHNTVWISLFVIDKQFRQQSYAREAMEGIALACKTLGYEKIGIGVFLENHRAWKFWKSIGFKEQADTIVPGDPCKKSFTLVKLEKCLLQK